MESNTLLFIIIAIVVVSILVYQFFFGDTAKIKRKLKNAPYTSIQNFKHGEIAKIVGVVEPIDDPLIAPLTRRKCCYYYILVERQVHSKENSYWETYVEEVFSSKFVINENDFRAYIPEKDIKSYVVVDAEFSSGIFNDANGYLNSFLKQHGKDSTGMLGFNKTLRYKEAILEVGEEIAVLGEGKWKDSLQPELPESLGKVLYLRSTPKMPLFLSDSKETTGKITFTKEQRKEFKTRYNR